MNEHTRPFPLVTMALIICFSLLFALELLQSQDWWGPTGAVLYGLGGGMIREVILQNGEWYRLFSTSWFHASYVQWILNVAALYSGGQKLEVLVGRAWWFTLFVITGALGAAVALWQVEPMTPILFSPTGGILGLSGVSLVLLKPLPPGPQKTFVLKGVLPMLTFGLLAIFTSQTGWAAYFGYVGSFLSGLILGFLFLRFGERPGFGKLGVLFGVACVALGITCGLKIVGSQKTYQQELKLARLLTPPKPLEEAENMETVPEQLKALQDLKTRYPQDPRLYMYEAWIQLEGHNPQAAALTLKQALSMGMDILKEDKIAEAKLRELLAKALLDQGLEKEAQEAFQPACSFERHSFEVVSQEWIASICPN